MRASLLLVALLMAGCNSLDEQDDDDADGPTQEPCIRRALLDEAIMPIPDATLTTEHGDSTTTDANGSFCLELPDGVTDITVTTPDRTGIMTCSQGGDEPEMCSRVRWIE